MDMARWGQMQKPDELHCSNDACRLHRLTACAWSCDTGDRVSQQITGGTDLQVSHVCSCCNISHSVRLNKCHHHFLPALLAVFKEAQTFKGFLRSCDT